MHSIHHIPLLGKHQKARRLRQMKMRAHHMSTISFWTMHPQMEFLHLQIMSRARYMAHNSEQGNDLHESLIDFVHPSSTVLCMSRPPPSVNASLNLWGRLCADDSPYRRSGYVHSQLYLPQLACSLLYYFIFCSTTVIQFGTTPLTGALIALSFSDAALADSIFMSFFVQRWEV